MSGLKPQKDRVVIEKVQVILEDPASTEKGYYKFNLIINKISYSALMDQKEWERLTIRELKGAKSI